MIVAYSGCIFFGRSSPFDRSFVVVIGLVGLCTTGGKMHNIVKKSYLFISEILL